MERVTWPQHSSSLSSFPSCGESGRPWTTMVFVMFLLWKLQSWTTTSFSWKPKHWDPGSLCSLCLPKAPTNVSKTSKRKWWSRKHNPQRKWSRATFMLLEHIIHIVSVWQKQSVFAFRNYWTVGNCVLFSSRMCWDSTDPFQTKTTRRNNKVIRYSNMHYGQRNISS